jgi:hypothetical protein
MRLFIACAVSALIVLASPFMGRLQSLLRSSVSTRVYVLLLGGVVIGSIVAAIVVAFIRNRGNRTRRVAAMGAAIGLGLAYTTAMSTGDPTVDAVERVHFIEFGLIAVLFYRVWRRPSATLGAALSNVEGRVGDVSTLILPLLCGFIVGTLDEWLQWFVPYRVGEMHDVFLNLTALAGGVLFGIALEPPPSFQGRPDRHSLSTLVTVTAIALLVFAGFINSVHVGHEVSAEGIGRFKSHHTIAELDALQRDRNARWAAEPPIGIRRLSREDQYLDEALWHVRERNRLWDEGNVTGAWHENLILERFFVPVLDRPTYVSPEGTRWPPAHRADAESRRQPLPAPFVSVAEPRVILPWNKTQYWLIVGIAVAALITVGVRMRA